MIMDKSCTIQDVFERFYPSYEKRSNPPAHHRKTAYHIRNCKTGVFGSREKEEESNSLTFLARLRSKSAVIAFFFLFLLPKTPFYIFVIDKILGFLCSYPITVFRFCQIIFICLSSNSFGF